MWNRRCKRIAHLVHEAGKPEVSLLFKGCCPPLAAWIPGITLSCASAVTGPGVTGQFSNQKWKVRPYQIGPSFRSIVRRSGPISQFPFLDVRSRENLIVKKTCRYLSFCFISKPCFSSIENGQILTITFVLDPTDLMRLSRRRSNRPRSTCWYQTISTHSHIASFIIDYGQLQKYENRPNERPLLRRWRISTKYWMRRPIHGSNQMHSRSN